MSLGAMTSLKAGADLTYWKPDKSRACKELRGRRAVEVRFDEADDVSQIKEDEGYN